MDAPQGLRNKALVGAFRKGALAHQAGQPIEACPYSDKRKPDGRLSWSRAFRSMWLDGWRWSAKQAGSADPPGPL